MACVYFVRLSPTETFLAFVQHCLWIHTKQLNKNDYKSNVLNILNLGLWIHYVGLFLTETFLAFVKHCLWNRKVEMIRYECLHEHNHTFYNHIVIATARWFIINYNLIAKQVNYNSNNYVLWNVTWLFIIIKVHPYIQAAWLVIILRMLGCCTISTKNRYTNKM